MTLPRVDETANVVAQIGTNFPWTATAAVPGRDLRMELVMTNETSLGGIVTWHTNHATIGATFARSGTLPEQAFVQVKGFRIGSKDLDLRGYDNVNGALNANWAYGKFALDLHANATPLATSTNLEPFTATIAASGDTNAATLETLTMSSPGMEAHLLAPLSVSFKGEMLNPSASFVVKADLSKQQFLPVRGLVTGTASLQRKAGTYPQVTFAVSGDHVTGYEVEAAAMKTHGQLNWPVLELQNLDVRFDNGTTANITTGVDLEKRVVQHGTIQFSGKIGEDLLPVGYDYERLSLRADFSGPVNALKHSGELNFGEVVVPYVKSFRASAKWDGQGTDLKTFEAEMRVSNTALMRMSGSAALSRFLNTRHIDAKLDKLSIVSGNQTFALKTSTRLNAEVTRTNKHAQWTGNLSSVQLRSANGDLMVEGNLKGTSSGQFSIYGHRLESRLANAFLIRPIPEVRIGQIAASAVWSNAPAKWNVDVIAQYLQRDTNKAPVDLSDFSARIQMFGDERGTTVTNVTLSQQGQAVAAAFGVLPITIEPARADSGLTNIIRMHGDDRINFRATTRTNIAFWGAVTRGLPATISSPTIDVAIDGTLNNPHGIVHCAIPAGTINLLTISNRLAFSNFKADIGLSRREMILTNLSALLEGQPISATGTLPLPADIEHNWRKITDWRKARVQIRAANVEIAPFAGLQRRFISPQGTVSANINLDRGEVDGSLAVIDAATRPIAQFGAIRDINARINFTRSRLVIERCVGNLSGGPIGISGWADLSRMDRKTKLPAFELNVRGDSVPVARRSDLIVRTGFNLVAANTNNGAGIVTGTVNLQNSYVLSDLKLLVPPHVAKPQNRPPYFSVETEPISNWKLDVKVKGDHFLKVRSPFFNGECSADLHLGGSLREPVAIGDVIINSGAVQFPFANVKVNQGYVSLTTAHPYMPYLFITGSTKAYEYDIRMNVTGPVSDPKIEFTSTPGLPSEQVLVMLTTGELPATTSALTTQQRTLRVGAFVGKNLLSRFGITGDDQRLTLESGRDVSEQNTETYSAEYKVNPDWSVIGDYNRFGGINLGLKWRFFSK
ncbi:MAG: translocation/assembly module TamB domain-containing protein [Limisphaerales bacterium]